MDAIRMEATGWRGMVPAGRYIVGDPCYFSSRNAWEHLLNETDHFDNPVGSLEVMAGENSTERLYVVALGTAHGDGTFAVHTRASKRRQDKDLSVDSGLLGLVPMALVESEWGRTDSLDSGAQVAFSHATEVSMIDGVFGFSVYEVDTNEEADRDEEDE